MYGKTNRGARFVRHLAGYSDCGGTKEEKGMPARDTGKHLGDDTCWLAGEESARGLLFTSQHDDDDDDDDDDIQRGMTMHTRLHLLLNVILKLRLVPLVHAYMHPLAPSPPPAPSTSVTINERTRHCRGLRSKGCARERSLSILGTMRVAPD